MDMFRSADYARLRSVLRTDKHNLDGELIEMPQWLIEVSEICTQAVIRKDEADGIYKTSVAIAAAELRSMLSEGGKKKPETEIAAEAPLQEAPQQAAANAADAKADLAYWMALGEALRAKHSSMKRLVDLAIFGYIGAAAGSAYGTTETHEAGREDMAAARRASLPRRPVPRGG